jgi:thymidylate synthase
MNNNTHNRLLASQSSSFRQYAENYDEVVKICEETGRKPAEILRDAIDEWLFMRRSASAGGASTKQEQNGDLAAKIEELRLTVERLVEQIEALAQSFDYVQRRDHGYLLEIFLAAYGARDLIWRDVSNRMRQGKQTPESIQKQYEALQHEWNAQCDATADQIQEIIRKGRHNAQVEPRQG